MEQDSRTAAVVRERFVQSRQLVPDDGMDSAFGTSHLIHLPEVLVHSREVGRNSAADALGQGFGLLDRQDGQGPADRQYAKELTADHLVGASRTRGVTELVPDSLLACGSGRLQQAVQLSEADFEGGGQASSLGWLRGDSAAFPASDRRTVHAE
ncbi:hypothetical protein [Streptomyces sp. NPDC058418]|uniref:hypothetical protein n=1 Tax=unclassified Streptomyces TaxID=2593676 RepID=UPI003653CCF1